MKDHTNTLLYRSIINLGKIPTIDMVRLFEIADHRQIAKGEFILKDGQICSCITFVEKGHLRTSIHRDGSEINTNFTLEGNFTTNLRSLRHASQSEYSIQAGEQTTIFQFDKDRLIALYESSSEIESFARKILEQLMMDLEEHTNLFKVFSPRERYKYLQDNNPVLLQRISLSQLSSYLGMARETLGRIRQLK